MVWQHDIFRKDRTPYDGKELGLFRETIRQSAANVTTNEGRWPAAKAWAWHSQHPWLVGCRFLPIKRTPRQRPAVRRGDGGEPEKLMSKTVAPVLSSR